MNPSPPGAVVLCGGRSRRMQRDKASLPFGDGTMLDRVLRQIAPHTQEIVLAAAASGPALPAGFRASRDSAAGEGPLPALLGALELIGAEQVFVVACDMPLLQGGLIPLLAQLAGGWDGAVPVVEGQVQPACAVYRTSALAAARAGFGEPRHRSVREFVAGLRLREVTAEVLETVDPGLLSFTKCNTPAEYAHALRLAGLLVNGPLPGAV